MMLPFMAFFFMQATAAEPTKQAETDKAPVVKTMHTIVYYEPGRFGGWPANHGIWAWGDEILVGFSAGYYKDLGPERHAIDREKPESHWLARSLDGGETWSIEDPSETGYLVPQGNALHGTETPGRPIPKARDCEEAIDFLHPDFAMTVRMLDKDAGPSLFHYSYDRGRTWNGPFRLPDMGTRGIAGRTDYIVLGRHECLLFLTAAKQNGKEGRPFCARTLDGAKTWSFVGWIGPEPSGYAIMPTSVRLSASELLTVVRRKDESQSWLAAYVSEDGGRVWRHLNDPVDDLGEGNPASLIRLTDGRLCLTYGVRKAPYRMCAKISADQGRTWGPELVLRDDGANRDLGYARSVQRSDGRIVTVYYFNDKETGPERYIAATIWDATDVR